MKPVWHRAATYAELDLTEHQGSLIETYGAWLADEGRRAGGIGPEEVHRIDRRHLADALLFASQLPAGVPEVWDLGSGVGLPGIPLAIAMPDSEFLLVDRAGRRTDLIRRALRVLELGNCQVLQGDITDLEGKTAAIVSRASLRPTTLAPVISRYLMAGGVAVVGGSWQEPPEHPGWRTVEIPPYVLDQSVWLLIMRPE